MTEKETKEDKYLTGFKLLILLLAISLILHIKDLFVSNQSYFFSILLTGIVLKLYFIFLIVLKSALIYGLIDRWKWAFYLFLAYNLFQFQSIFILYTLRNYETLFLIGLVGFGIDVVFLIYVIMKRKFLYRESSKK